MPFLYMYIVKAYTMAYKLTPAQLQAKWAQYRKLCDEHVEAVRYRGDILDMPKRIIYSIDGFCSFAGMEEADLQVLEANKNFRATVRLIRYTILARKLEALVNGEGSTTGLIFDLKANYGLYPKRKSDVTNDWLVTLNLGKEELKKEAAGKEEQPVEDNITLETLPSVPEPETINPVPVKPVVMPTGRYSVW